MANPIKLAGMISSIAMLAACSPASDGSVFTQSWNKRYGPSPTISANAAQESANAQTAIVEAFRSASGDAGDYFGATLIGFNFVDEQCDAYLQALYVLDRERDSTKTGLNAVAQVTNAILGITPASKLTMGVVTQAFGLGGQFADDLLKGYLYGKSPAVISHVVDVLRDKYRTDTASAKSDINSSGVPLAYAYIRGYLKLCLPSTISASIDNAAATATATTESDTKSPNTKKTANLMEFRRVTSETSRATTPRPRLTFN
ncbi:MAG TPA: hypothetical protein VN112_15745 [Ensifer sp.]|nr:hypothetical protein [Ensifer sp.]